MGLFYKCAVPWTKEHKCAPEVLLVVEAVWDAFDQDDVAESSTPDSETDAQVFLAISKAAVLGNSSARTVRFSGYMQGHPVHILIDSGSSTSFLSETVASQLSGIQSEPVSTRVQVAGGTHLQSSVLLRNVPWSVGQCVFQSTFRVLPLKAYDAIVGMDWLESFSPMQVHWRDKWLLIPYQG
jgi:predicted aspartyl protease